MTNGPIQRYKSHLALNERKRKAAMDAADGAPKKKAPPAEKNPYPPGSARAKYWARRQADKKAK